MTPQHWFNILIYLGVGFSIAFARGAYSDDDSAESHSDEAARVWLLTLLWPVLVPVSVAMAMWGRK